MNYIKRLLISRWPQLIIILLVLVLFGQTLVPPSGQVIFGGDINGAYFYWKNYLKESILSGIIPFWNPYNYSGTPFLAHPDINIFYPFNWLFVLLPLNQSFSIYFFVHIIIAGVTMYWLVRQFASKTGALASGITYSLGGFFAARIYSGHLEYVDAASWMPLVFGMTRKALFNSSPKNILLASISWAVLILCGNELFLLFSLELAGLYILFLIFRNIKKNNLLLLFLRYIKVVILSIIIAFSLTAIEFLPRFQFISLSLRSEGLPYGTAVSGSLPVNGVRLFIQPLFYGSPFPENYSYSGPWPNLFEYTNYIGILPVLLPVFFIAALVLSKFYKKIRLQNINKDIWFFLIFVIPIFLLISLGSNISPNIHELLWKYTPLYKGIRFPARHLFVVAFALSAVFGILIDGVKNKILVDLFIVIATVDLLIFDKQFFRLASFPTSTFDKNLISILQKDDSLYRLLPDYYVVSPVRRDLDFGAASKYKIQTTSDYNSMILWQYYHFIDLMNQLPISSIQNHNVEIPQPDPWSPLIDFLNIKYILSDKMNDLIENKNSQKYKLVLEGEKYRLYQNNTYSPRFFFVDQAQVYSSENELEEVIKTRSVDFSKTILLLKKDLPKDANINLTCDQVSDKVIKVVHYSPNSINLETLAPCNYFLSSSEVYYPGWKAKIDGKETKMYLSNFTFRGIFVPKGRHKIEFYYEPTIFYISGTVTVVTIAGLIWLFRKYQYAI